eukprot:4067946-Ditylum_brightwellii.AAC.1
MELEDPILGGTAWHVSSFKLIYTTNNLVGMACSTRRTVEILLDRTPATSTFTDLVSNYDLVVHSIASLAYQWVRIPKVPVFCTFSTSQDM